MSDHDDDNANQIIQNALESQVKKSVKKKVYKRKHGDYKAEFEGKAPGWEPTSCLDVFCIVCITIFTYIICSAMIVSGLFLVRKTSSRAAVGGGFVVVLTFVLFLILMMFCM